MFSAIADGFSYLFSLLGDLGLFILNGIMKMIQPIIDFIGAIFYFVYKLGLVLVKVLALFGTLARLLVGLLTGLFKTITGLAYTGAGAEMPASYQSAFDNLQPVFNQLQFNKLGYVLIFTVWLFTAFVAVKIIGNMRGGGGSD